MRKLVVLIIGLIGIFGLSGCDSNYKCDKKEYAESALNLALFGKATGSDDKNITIQSLGFEISDDIIIARLDKDKKQSVCQVKVNNKILAKAIDIEKQMESNKELYDKLWKEHISTIPEPYEYLFVDYLSRLNSSNPATLIAMGDFYKIFYGQKAADNPIAVTQLIHTLAMLASKYAYSNEGLAYKVFDNGNGDIMVGL